jgi:enoyl-CoA hydratase/carnithine racemase
MQESVLTTTKNNITTITFYHPAHNSMPANQLKALTESIDAAGESPDSTIIILQSAGDRTFCAGASFDELAAINTFEEGKKFFMGFANVINACRKSPKLIIGRVQGKAVGGGLGITAAVDYCFATKYASVKLSELALGIGPFVVGPAVERKTGLSAFSQLAINATDWQTAQWAKENGIYAEVYESTSELDTRITEFAAKLAAMSPDALSELKRIFWKDAEDWDILLESRAEISGRLVLSDFAKEAIARIRAKS